MWPDGFGAEIWPRSMPTSLVGGEVDVSTGLAGVNVPSRKRGASNGGEGPPLEPGLLGNCWCCLCGPRHGDEGWRGGRRDSVAVA